MSIIDVRDLAALHVAACELESASGRYFGVNRSFPWSEILASLHAVYPAYTQPPLFEGAPNTATQFDHTRKDSRKRTTNPHANPGVSSVRFGSAQWTRGSFSWRDSALAGRHAW